MATVMEEQEQEKDLGDYLSILARHKMLMAAVMAVILIVSIVIAYRLPAIYKSTSTILIEKQEVPQDFVRTLVTSFAEQRIQVISQKILSTRNLIPFLEKYDMYTEARKVSPIEAVVAVMRKNISLDMISADVVDPRSGQARSATIAFSLSFEDPSPKLAQNVVNELTTLFLEENIKNRTEVAIEASAFLTVEGKKLSARIGGLEAKLAEFKEANAGVLPEFSKINVDIVRRTEQDILDAKRQVKVLREKKIFLTSELELQPETIDEQRYNPAFDIQQQKFDRRMRVGQLDPDIRLEALQSEYLSSLSKYSAGHPDVQRLKREIDSLRLSVGSASPDTTILERRIAKLGQTLETAKERYSSDHPDVRRYERELKALEDQRNSTVVQFGKAGAVTESRYLIKIRPNAAHVQLKARLDAADADLTSLSARIVELESKYDDYQLRVARAPQIERQYRELTRDFNTANEKYQGITSKQLEAELAQSLESEQKGERFTLIEPPTFPESPFKPNRLAIVFLGFIFSLAGGIGAAALAEAFNDSVRGRKGVAEIMGEPPLAIVPFIVTEKDSSKKTSQKSVLAFGAAASLVVVAVLIHLYLIPLDVLWFKSLRSAGM